MVTKKTKSFKVDFYAVLIDGKRHRVSVRDLLLAAAENGHSDAYSLEEDSDEKFQLRSVVVTKNQSVIRGVFGRCRYNEKPVQGTDDGNEADVELLPNHGLVQKNHFLFYPDRNLFVYQRNSAGSHYAKLQHFLNVATEKPVLLEPILTRDSYARILGGKGAKTAEFSFIKPADVSLYKGTSLGDAMSVASTANSATTKVKLSVGRTGGILSLGTINGIIDMARNGRARVARVTLHEDSQPIDLIADRIAYTITVNMNSNRPDPEHMYACLADAESKKRDDIKAFFG